MLTKRNRNERGPTDLGWLQSMHSFSFGNYYDEEHIQFGPLRVINEDRVAPSAGFNTHPHDNMEIISYVIEGELEHKDSMGNGSKILPCEIQLMSAGKGVTHSEYNSSSFQDVHFLQIWILPNVQNKEPSYQQRVFPEVEQHNRFRVVVSPSGELDSITIKQDVWMYVGKFTSNEVLNVDFLRQNRRYWLQIVRGKIDVNGMIAVAGDGVAITEETALKFHSIDASEVILFDLP